MNRQKDKRIIGEPAPCMAMNGLEVITVRVADRDELERATEYCARFFDTVSTGEKDTLNVFRSAGYESDLSVHLHSQVEPSRAEKSILGLRLAHGLSIFGIVSHTLWLEQNNILR